MSSQLPYANAREPPDAKQGMCTSDSPAPVDPEVAVGVSSVSYFADTDWERSLQGRLDEVVHYGLTILPYEELFSLATKKAFPNVWSTLELPKYLCGRLNSRNTDEILQRSQGLHLGYAGDFLTQFCLALENCYTNALRQSLSNEADERQEVLWVYAPRQTELPCIRRLPCSITEPIRHILTMLHKYPYLTGDSITFDGDVLQGRRGVANLGRVFNIGALIEAWRREGYHEHLLRRYVWYRMIKQAPSRQREVDLFVSELFDQPWEKRRWDQTAGKADEPDLRIHYLR